MSNHHNREALETSEKHSEQHSTQRHESRLEKAHDFGNKNHELNASREKRAEIAEKMVLHDMPETPEKRLTSAKDFHFQSDNDFEQELKRRDPVTTDDETHRTDGFHDPRDHQAYVRDHGNTYETSIHEKYHQKSHTDMPTGMNEGVTEYLAREKAGGIGRLRDIDNRGRDVTPPLAYENEVAAVRKMAATVGDDQIKTAYFEGKTDELRKSLDSVRGDGAYERLQNAVERDDPGSADKVFEGKDKKEF